MCPSEMPSSNLTPSTGTLTVHQGPGTPSMLYPCHRFSSLVGFRAPCAGSSPRATEQGDSCPVLWQSWGEAACCCPACLPPPRLASLLGKAAAACGTWGFCISPGRTERRGRDVGPVYSLDCTPISKEGEGKRWFVFKNTSVPRALCDSFNAFFSQAVSLAPGCFQPHSLLWDLSLLGLWLQQRLYCIFISQVPFWF